MSSTRGLVADGVWCRCDWGAGRNACPPWLPVVHCSSGQVCCQKRKIQRRSFASIFPLLSTSGQSVVVGVGVTPVWNVLVGVGEMPGWNVFVGVGVTPVWNVFVGVGVRVGGLVLVGVGVTGRPLGS